MRGIKYTLAIVVCSLLSLLVALQVYAHASETPIDTKVQIYLPLISETNSHHQSLEATPPSIASLTSWSTYHSPELHITVTYPSAWHLEAPQIGKPESPNDLPKEFSIPDKVTPEGYVISLIPPKGDVLDKNKIEITVQGYEIEAGQSLNEWDKNRTELENLVGLHNHITATITQSEVTTADLKRAREPEQVMHLSTDIGGYGETGQTVFFTKGRLVYAIIGLGADSSSEMRSLLQQMTKLVQFEINAPEDLNSLYNTDIDRLTIQETIDLIRKNEVPPETCGIVCRDAEASKGLPPDPDLEGSGHVEASSQQGVNVAATLQALPPNWLTPIYTSSSKNVACGSGGHTGNAEFALDIGVGLNTSVYASQYGVVTYSNYDSVTGPTGTSYGNTIILDQVIAIADENRSYRQRYAHLNQRLAVVGDLKGGGNLIAYSGNTGGTTQNPLPYHLHFDIYKNDNSPVDATPVLGFVPNLLYPSSNGSCGQIISILDAPITIEPVAFSARYNGALNHYWFCYAGGHTVECFMRAVPNDGSAYEIIGTQTYPGSPWLAYNVYAPGAADYRIWVCGRGGSTTDDSLHMGKNETAAPNSTRIASSNWWGSSWAWGSSNLDGNTPYLSLGNSQTVNVWMREDGMRIGRIVLTRSFAATPPTVRCGSYP